MQPEFSKYLSELDANDLNKIVDDDLASELGPDDTIISLVKNAYPGLFEFARGSVTRMPGFDEMAEDERNMYLINNLVVLGAICRKIETDSMPTLD